MDRKINSYDYMHVVIKKKRGKARERQCEHCDQQAAQWALSATAEEIVYQEGTQEYGRAFSRDVNDYMSLCRLCHTKYDREHGLTRSPAGNHTSRPRLNNCTVEDCVKPHKARGLCGMHYKRLRDRNKK